MQKSSETETDFSYRIRLQLLEKNRYTTKNNRPYLTLTMRDKHNTFTKFKKWTDNEEEFSSYFKLFQIGKIYEIEAIYSKQYNSSVIIEFKKLNSNEYQLEHFIPPSNKNIDDLINELFKYIQNIKNECLKELLTKTFSIAKIRMKYISCPASIKHHHAYEHGNLEHVISMLNLLERLIKFYGQHANLDIDLIKTGIIFHDIGKIKEYSVINSVPSRNNKAAMLTHITLGDSILIKIIRTIQGFPKDLENKLRHIISSHHGRKEWGAPIEPGFPEAEIVHLLDMIDSRFALPPNAF